MKKYVDTHYTRGGVGRIKYRSGEKKSFPMPRKYFGRAAKTKSVEEEND